MASRTQRFAALTFLRRLLRLAQRRRRLMAALLFCAAAAVAVNQLTPPTQTTESALALSKDLPAGATILAADLTVIRIPPTALPQSALRKAEQAVGQQLAGALRKGQILTDTSLLGQSLLTGAPPGSVAVPLRLADQGTTTLLSPGQLVNVVLTSEDSTGRVQPGTILADSIPVLWVQAQNSTAGNNGTNWLPAKEMDGLVVVAASAEQSKVLAGSSTRGKLSLVLIKPN